VTFDLITILIFCAGALLYLTALPAQLRQWALLAGSVLAAYWLQPRIVRVPYVDFILPTAMIILALVVWWFTLPRDDKSQLAQILARENLLALSLILLIILGVAATRYLDAAYRLTSRPPDLLHVAIVLTGVALFVSGLSILMRVVSQRRILTGLILLIVSLFVVLKTEALAIEAARFWRGQTARDTSLASVNDIAWLGFSYLAFRLIHVLRDRQTGKLPALTLREFMTYAIFFPAYTAGPIDRAERFSTDYRNLPSLFGLDPSRLTQGLTRIAIGIFKKFVIADTLALGLSLNATNALQADSMAGLWLLLYGYALRLFFDFSGYSDIAIGIALLFGIKLPENFDRPYQRTNITAFWQSWHITLSNWARFYVFSPLSRFLLTRQPKPSSTAVVLSTQLATMIVIGLWHGVSWNFLIWGLWHGTGLFVHKQWSDRTRVWYRGLNEQPGRKRIWIVVAWFITFHFVVIGWVWFALPNMETSLDVLRGLFGG
jgi:alginate O-acetyltransferase complex protein AlgI